MAARGANLQCWPLLFICLLKCRQDATTSTSMNLGAFLRMVLLPSAEVRYPRRLCQVVASVVGRMLLEAKVNFKGVGALSTFQLTESQQQQLQAGKQSRRSAGLWTPGYRYIVQVTGPAHLVPQGGTCDATLSQDWYISGLLHICIAFPKAVSSCIAILRRGVGAAMQARLSRPTLLCCAPQTFRTLMTLHSLHQWACAGHHWTLCVKPLTGGVPKRSCSCIAKSVEAGR